MAHRVVNISSMPIRLRGAEAHRSDLRCAQLPSFAKQYGFSIRSAARRYLSSGVPRELTLSTSDSSSAQGARPRSLSPVLEPGRSDDFAICLPIPCRAHLLVLSHSANLSLSLRARAQGQQGRKRPDSEILRGPYNYSCTEPELTPSFASSSPT